MSRISLLEAGGKLKVRLFPKRTLKHLAELAKLLNCVVSIYLYCAFDRMLLSCHIRV